jgi:hypothetical protein
VLDGTTQHVFAVDPAAHLRDFAQAQGGAWSSGDLTATVPGSPAGVAGQPAAVLAGADLRVFALAAGTNHLVQWDRSGGSWTTSDLSALTQDTTPLTRTPDAVFDGTTVHVYVVDANAHLLDFFLTQAAWHVLDLSAATVTTASGSPSAYSDGTFMHVSVVGSNGHLLAFTDGMPPTSIRPQVTDVTTSAPVAAFPTSDTSAAFTTPGPGVFNPGRADVFADGSMAGAGNHLIDWFKNPGGPWGTLELSAFQLDLGRPDQTPFAGVQEQGNFELVRRASDAHLIEFFPYASGVIVIDVSAATGQTVSSSPAAAPPPPGSTKQVFAVS